MISLPKTPETCNLTDDASEAIEHFGTIHIRWLLEVWPMRPTHCHAVATREYDAAGAAHYDALQRYVAAYGPGALYGLCGEVACRRAGSALMGLLVLLGGVGLLVAIAVAGLQ